MGLFPNFLNLGAAKNDKGRQIFLFWPCVALEVKKMNAIVSLVTTVLLLYGSGYAAKALFSTVQEITVKRIKKGLSSSEAFAQQLTRKKLKF